MKKILTNNLWLKILSIIIAFLGWLVIINYDDPTITRTISGIKVQLENEQSIADAGKCYTVEAGNVVSVVVRGKKSVVDTLVANDFVATADLSKYSITNAVPVVVATQMNYGQNLDIIEGKTSTMMIDLENYVKKQFSVSAVVKGEVAEGYYIGSSEITVSPNRIELSGPESVIKKVASVKCVVDVTDASSRISTVSDPIAYDKSGYIINSDRIDFSVSNISATGMPWMMKTVPVIVDFTGSALEGYAVTGVSTSVKEVSIASSDSQYIRDLESVTIEVSDIGLFEKLKKEININDIIPQGAKVVSEDNKTNVIVKVAQLEEREINFSANDIKFSNLMTNISCDYDGNTRLSVKVRGLSKNIEGLIIDNLNPTVDVSGLNLGIQNAIISFSEIEGVEIMTSPTLRIKLEDMTVVPPTLPPENEKQTDVQAETEDDVTDDRRNNTQDE